MNNNENVSQNASNNVNNTTTNVNPNQSVPTSNGTKAPGSMIQEVTVNVDSSAFNKIDASEVSENSVFNKDNSNTVSQASTTLKEGDEDKKTKKGFPFFMIIIFAAFVASPFFLDDIMEYLNNLGNKKPIQEQNVVKIVSLDEIKTSLASSKYVEEFTTDNDLNVEVSIDDDKLLVNVTNLLDEQNPNDISVEFELQDNVLTAMCDYNNSDVGLEVSKIIIKEVALIQGVDSSKVDEYVDNNLYTSTIDKGFELTHSEDGNNTYKIATNIKLSIE